MATDWRWGGRIYFGFVCGSSLNKAVKELLKSVHICQRYRKNKSGPYFYDPRCIFDNDRVLRLMFWIYVSSTVILSSFLIVSAYHGCMCLVCQFWLHSCFLTRSYTRPYYYFTFLLYSPGGDTGVNWTTTLLTPTTFMLQWSITWICCTDESDRRVAALVVLFTSPTTLGVVPVICNNNRAYAYITTWRISWTNLLNLYAEQMRVNLRILCPTGATFRSYCMGPNTHYRSTVECWRRCTK